MRSVARPFPRAAAAPLLGLALAFAFASCGERDVGGSGTRLPRGEGDLAIHVVVSGTDYEMGWHHGRLLRDEIRSLVPAWLDASFKTGRSAEEATFLRDTACRLYATQMLRLLPESVREELRGIADGSGVGADDLFLLEVLRDGLMMHKDAARPIGALFVTVPPKDPNLPALFAVYSAWNPELHGARWVVLERRPTGRTPTMVLTWAGGLGGMAGVSKNGLVAAHAEIQLEPERLSLNGMPFAIAFRVALETAGSADGFIDALPQTVGHRVIASDREGKRRAALVAHVGSEVTLDKREGMMWLANAPVPDDAKKIVVTWSPTDPTSDLWRSLWEMSGIRDQSNPGLSLDARGISWAPPDPGPDTLRESRYDWSAP